MNLAMGGTMIRHDLQIVRSFVSRWRVIGAADEPSLGDRLAATVRAVETITIPNLLSTLALCGVYAVRLDAFWLLLAAIPMVVTQAGAMTCLPGARFSRRKY